MVSKENNSYKERRYNAKCGKWRDMRYIFRLTLKLLKNQAT